MFLSMEGFNSRLNTTGKLVNQKIKSEENVWNRTLKGWKTEKIIYTISRLIGRKGQSNIIVFTEDRMEEQQYIRTFSKTADT